jgi:hypothetical protein
MKKLLNFNLHPTFFRQLPFRQLLETNVERAVFVVAEFGIVVDLQAFRLKLRESVKAPSNFHWLKVPETEAEK